MSKFVPFCLQKKRPENTFFTLTVNYCKIIQKNKLCHPKQQQIGYLIIYDVIYSLLVFTEKLVFFNKQLYGFIISLTPWHRLWLSNKSWYVAFSKNTWPYCTNKTRKQLWEQRLFLKLKTVSCRDIKRHFS